ESPAQRLGSSPGGLAKDRPSYLRLAYLRRLASRFARRLWILPLPFALLLFGEETDLGRLAFGSPTLLDDPEIAIDLNMVQGVDLKFSMTFFKLSDITLPGSLNIAAEIGVQRCPMQLEEDDFFVETVGIQAAILSAPEPFESLDGL